MDPIMQKISKLFILMSASLTLLFCGCSIFPKNETIPVTYFDIGAPGKIANLDNVPPIDIQEVRTTDPYNERMVFRASETQIKIDEYNRWASAPNEMLKKYFILALNQYDTNKLQLQNGNRFELSMTIMCLEANLNTKEVMLELLFEITTAQNNKIVYTEVMKENQKVDSLTAESFAGDVKILADQMLKSLTKNISQINSQK